MQVQFIAGQLDGCLCLFMHLWHDYMLYMGLCLQQKLTWHNVYGFTNANIDTDEGSRGLPKRLNYCFSVLASATNRSI